MKRILILIITIATMISCSKQNKEQLGPEIRLSNSSQFLFKNIIVDTGTGRVNFGDLESGKQTEYKSLVRLTDMLSLTWRSMENL